ncbi:MAG TPA: phosphatase PAP2 family protein [Solirubrobacteraceae bacterium]
MTAVSCAVGIVVVGVLALKVQATHNDDATIMQGFSGLAPDRLYEQIRVIALIVDPVPYACMGLACIAVALARGLKWRALATGVVLLGSGATTQVLKHLLAQPRYAAWLYWEQVDGAAWPSGHGTAAMTIALCAVLVAPPTYRAAAGFVGFCMTVALAYATLALTWHYPSDVAAGFLVAGLWVSLAIVWLKGVEEVGDPEAEPLPPFGWLVAAGTGCVLFAGAAVWIASYRVSMDTSDRAIAAAGALVIAALALVLVVATLVAASKSSAAERRQRVSQPERWVSPASGARSS